MPIYKAPVDDVLFLLNDVFHMRALQQSAGLFRCLARRGRSRSSARPRSSARRCCSRSTASATLEGCTRHDDGRVTTPTGFKEAFAQLREGGWIGISAPAEFGGQGLPMTMTTLVNEFQCSANMAFAMYPRPDAGRDRGADRACRAGAEGRRILPKMMHRRLDRHHEPDRAALRHRSRPAAHQGGAAAGRQLQDHRHQDLHLGRRARPGGQHRPPGAGAHRGRAGGRDAAFRCSWCRSCCPMPTARSARATASPAAPSRRRWASTATRPA